MRGLQQNNFLVQNNVLRRSRSNDPTPLIQTHDREREKKNQIT